MSNFLVGLIDYGMGNLFSIVSACKSVGISYSIIKKPEDFKKNNFKGIILPGVGAFSEAMKELKKNKMDKFIKEWSLRSKPILAICLGYQLLFETSEEFETSQGLGILKGSVKSIKNFISPEELACVPIVGWQNTIINSNHFKFKNNCFNNKTEEYYYYLHSYFVEPKDFSIVSSTAKYANLSYAASITTETIFACQFHPEKSGEKGLDIYKNFKRNIS